MTDYTDAINSVDNAAPAMAVTSLDNNPDEGARALKLSRATGVAPQVVHADLEGFEKQHKANLTSYLVRNNNQLADYIRGNPLADVVSNDDYGNLTKFSNTASALNLLYKQYSPLAGFAKGTYESAVGALTQPVSEKEAEETTGMPATRAGLSLIHAPQQMLGLLMAPVGGAQEAARRFGAISGDPAGGERLARDIGGIVESEMGRAGEGTHGIVEAGERQRFAKGMADTQAFTDQAQAHVEALNKARPWVDAGLEPPRGVHPIIDEAKSSINAEILDRLDQNLAEAQTSLTRERSPELFQKFAEQHYGTSSIGISGDRVAELYGDRLPEPDDNILGWVPGISSKLEAAKSTGDDIHVPLATWMTRVDPKVAKDLHDHLRVWPGGITANEAKEPWEPKPVVDSPIAQARDASGTEPMFAIGDRKLELKQLSAPEGDFHEYQFHDQAGKLVGELTILPDPAKRELYVANINGMAGLYANSFGPSLVRDLKKQLKAIYPEYDWLTGQRVSGARYEAGVWEDMPLARVKLGLEDETIQSLSDFHEISSGSYMKHFGEGIYGGVIPTPEMTRHEAEVSSAIKEELQKIVPQADVHVVFDIEHKDVDGNITGAYIHGASPKILVGLFSDDPIGYGRHEGIHWLRNQGFFKEAEWNDLTRAAQAEDWIGRYGIRDRYDFLDEPRQIEESIAEAYRDWAKAKDEFPQPSNLVTQAFERIHQLYEAIKTRLKEIFGRELSPDELFQRISSGEIGRRFGEAEGRSAFAIEPEEIKAKLDNLRAGGAGLDSKTFAKLQELIQTRFKEDIEASQKRALAEQTKIQSKEWKAQSKELAKEIETTIRQRPDVMADLLIGSGEFAGKKLKQRYPLREADLTSEQKAALPRHYYSQDGLPVDATAKMVGFTSGDAMMEKLIEYNQNKGKSTAKEMLQKTIDAEVDRQMAQRHGDLQANIMLDAQDQALSENNLNILAEEWQGAAMQAGVAQVDKDLAKAEAVRMFGERKLSDVDSGRLMTQMAKHYQDATKALISGDPASAVVSLQRRYLTAVMAAEAKKLEKARAAFDKTAKQFAKREVPSVDPEYTNFIHDILTRVGKPVRRSIQDIQKQIEAGEGKTLQEFVSNKSASLREVPVWDQLFDQGWRKNLDDLSVDEFRAVHGSIKTLVHNGREEMKIYKAGEAADYAEVKKELINNIADSVKGEIRAPRKPTLLKSYFVKHLQMENILNRWDGFDPKGAWNQYVMRDLIDGANQVDVWKKEYAGRIKDLGVPKDIGKSIENQIFKDQDTQTLIPFTRKNLLSVMLNTGTGTGAKSNLKKLAGGYKLSTDEVMSWVHQHATAEDWKFVQGVWDIFADIKKKSDTMYRSLTGGVPAEDVPVYPIQTPHGTIKGGYYPIIHHAEMEGKVKPQALEQENYIRATTPAGYTKSRTGDIRPLALDMDQIPGRISQMLHDVGLRPAVLNAAKVFYDKDIRSAIRRHYGDEYKNEMEPYLQAVANSANRDNKSQSAFTRASEFLRQNIITTLIGLNPGTVMKHGPSALVTSMREVGLPDFSKAVASLHRINEAAGETNWQFAIKNSLELQRRDRNWQETLYGAAGALSPGDKFPEWRQRIMEWSSKPVAMSDMLSAVPTWLAAYEKEMGISGVHGDAIYAADRAVRRAHGSTAITGRTGIQRDSNPWLTSVYNYFSDIMNRQMETLWKAGDTLDMVKEGNRKAAMATVPALTASLFAYAVWPAIVEHLVSPENDDPKASWGKKAGRQMIQTAASSWIGVRDFTNAIMFGKDPQYGLTGTAGQELYNIFRDLSKDHPFAKEHAGKLIQDGASAVGAASGMVPAQIGKAGRYIHDVKGGMEHPKGPWSWLTGLRFGTTKGHSTTFQNYLRGENR